MTSIRCTFWNSDDLCGARDNSKLCEPAVSLPLASLDRDVTHLLVKVGAGGTKTSASHRVQHFPEYKLILNQAGRCGGVVSEEMRKMTICPRHRRKFTRLHDLSGPCQHPLHKGKNSKLRKPKKVTADISERIKQETGIVIPIAASKYCWAFLVLRVVMVIFGSL